ncbi:MAG: helix-turn-helix transcriptional regulator, partial [Treponema sp.]|nr:helix-turn-helix transcriptional regulator [Treponema sp.]
MDVKKIFGSNLKKYRKSAKITQEELAEKIGITPQHLSLIETGATFVSAELIENVSSALNVSISSLFFSQEEITGSESFISEIENIIH